MLGRRGERLSVKDEGKGGGLFDSEPLNELLYIKNVLKNFSVTYGLIPNTRSR